MTNPKPTVAQRTLAEINHEYNIAHAKLGELYRKLKLGPGLIEKEIEGIMNRIEELEAEGRTLPKEDNKETKDEPKS